MLKIYGRANSINVRKVLWMAAELDLTFEREDWGRGFRSTDEEPFRSVSAWGVIPVLDDDGFILRESNAIVRYLATKQGRTDLLPTDMRSRFEVEAWTDWSSTDLYQEVRPVFQGLVFKLPQFTDPNIIAAGIKGWTRQMQRLEDHFASGQPFLTGQTFTAADVVVGLNVNRWFLTPFDNKPSFAQISAYYDRLKERSAFLEHGANGLP